MACRPSCTSPECRTRKLSSHRSNWKPGMLIVHSSWRSPWVNPDLAKMTCIPPLYLSPLAPKRRHRVQRGGPTLSGMAPLVSNADTRPFRESTRSMGVPSSASGGGQNLAAGHVPVQRITGLTPSSSAQCASGPPTSNACSFCRRAQSPIDRNKQFCCE